MKKLSAILFAIILMMAACVCVHAEGDLTITTTRLTTGEAFKSYNGRVEATGGSGQYEFKRVDGVFPTGISMDTDGYITGTPQCSGSFVNIEIRVTDKVTGDYVEKVVKLTINPITVDIEISDTEHTYARGKKFTAKVVCTTDPSIIPIVTYGSNLPYVENVGYYNIKVRMPSGYSCNYGNDRVLTVNKGTAAEINIENQSVPHDGNTHEPEMSFVPDTLEHDVFYRKANESEYTQDLPRDRGLYYVLVRSKDPNYVNIEKTATFTITDEIVKYEIKNSTQNYTGNDLAPEIISSKPEVQYTVKYQNLETNEITDTVKDIGRYKVIITPEEGYVAAPFDKDVFVITENIVDFDITAEKEAITYGEYFSLTPNPKSECDLSRLQMTVINDETKKIYNLTDMLPVGTYSVIAMFDYAGGEFGVGNVTAPKLTVNPLIVSFTTDKQEYDYTGVRQIVQFTPSSELITESDYQIRYKYLTDNKTYRGMTEPGKYQVEVTIKNNNFTLDNAFSITLTIKPFLQMNIGNSPAAMIEKESSKDDQWRQEALNYLKENLSFSADYLPQGCPADINYPAIKGVNYDLDPSTIILRKWSDLKDPGMLIIDENGRRTIKGEVEGEITGTGLYMLNYNDVSGSMSRPVILLEDTFGDVNKDGFINAIDANFIRKRIASGRIEVQNVYDARICDVTKDGFLDMQDVNMLYNRFAVQMSQYYPWIK